MQRRSFLMTAAASALAAPFWPGRAVAQTSARARTLAAAMEAVRARDWPTALDLARTLPDQPARDVVLWHWLRAPEGRFEDYLDFLARCGDWPGLPLMRRRGEDAIPQGASADALRLYLGPDAPQTGTGSLRLADAERARGNAEAADRLVVTAWRDFPLDAETEEVFLARHGDLLARHHTARLDTLLWAGNTPAARRLMPRVPADWQVLAEARIALREDADGVDARIAAVPGTLAGDPGLAYERFLWRLRKRRMADALELMDQRSDSAESLGRPEMWGQHRAEIARDLMRDDTDRTAYRVAARHRLAASNEYGDYSELEWLAGYIALRKLGDAATALEHFRRFAASVASPISSGRAGYWEGRALEALGRADEARAAYARGAEHQTAFYGQLAAERAGLPADPALLGTERFPDWRTQRFMSSSVLQAALLLQEAGERVLAERWMVHLAETLSFDERGALADLAFDLGAPHIALMIAKYAASQGQILQRAYHPVTELATTPMPINPALTLAIARRESEFDPEVMSGAGARGLMQLMPRTGRAMADALGESFSEDRLLSDPAFNARLGSEYLRRQIEDFGEALTLVAAAYNAGPSRPKAWIERFGDPRDRRVDVIDWIEHIPFTETRNYIMRVTESRVVYGMRLAGRTLPWDVEAKLRGG